VADNLPTLWRSESSNVCSAQIKATWFWFWAQKSKHRYRLGVVVRKGCNSLLLAGCLGTGTFTHLDKDTKGSFSIDGHALINWLHVGKT